MKQAPIKEDEAERLAALRRYGILDTPPEAEFDDITQLAAQICATPIALISLADRERQWFKSRFGFSATELASDVSFCGHASHGTQVFEVTDALEDKRFADNPLVTGAPNLRFYAGVPLITPDGYSIGTLCVIDQVPRKLMPGQIAALETLGRQVMRQMAARLTLVHVEESHHVTDLLLNLLNAATELSIIATNPEGLITVFNRGAEQLLGYRANEMVGLHTTLELHLQTEIAAREAQLSQQLGRPITGFEVFTAIPQKQGTDRQKWNKVHKSGRLVPVMLSVTAMRDQAGNITGYFSMALDISHEVMVSEATSAAGVGIWDYDVPKNLLVWDEVMYQLYGTKEEDFAGCYEAWQAGVHPNDKERGNAEIALALSGEKPFDTEFRVVWPDGSVHWIRASATVHRDIHGQVMHMTGTNWDITASKQAEQAKTEFVSTVSHELRTPLTSINGALGLINSGVLGAVPLYLKPMLDIANKNSVRLASLINDLLDMEKMLAGGVHLELVDQPLLPLVEQAVETIRPYGEPLHVGFGLTQADASLKVRVDGPRLQQVLANLMSNAAKFSPADSQVEIRVIRHGAMGRVEVQDRGSGIAPEFRARMFQKFSQADSSDTRKKGGAGLGLAISKAMIERMNGQIDFVSEVGKGSCFYIELPLLTESLA